jgi:enoyl-CoA hydratase
MTGVSRGKPPRPTPPTVKTERRGRVAILTLNRPERLNAIGTPTIHDLAAILTDLAGDGDVGAVVITGEGKAFSAGADIAEFSAFQRPADFAEFIHRLSDTYAELQALPMPSIAAINGVAFGGGLELALACDLRVAAAGARLGVPEIKLGLLPGAGGTARLTRMLPPGIAKQLLLTGAPITASDAHRFGLVNEVVEEGAALTRSIELAETMAALPAQALAAAKRLVDQGVDMPLTAAVTLERETVSRLFGTDDRVEGVAAFLEKRPARFQYH